jgi:hypothetical protein
MQSNDRLTMNLAPSPNPSPPRRGRGCPPGLLSGWFMGSSREQSARGMPTPSFSPSDEERENASALVEQSLDGPRTLLKTPHPTFGHPLHRSDAGRGKGEGYASVFHDAVENEVHGGAPLMSRARSRRRKEAEHERAWRSASLRRPLRASWVQCVVEKRGGYS